MKLAFTSGLGDPKAMACACLDDLISIHDKLTPNQAIAPKLPAPDAPQLTVASLLAAPPTNPLAK